MFFDIAICLPPEDPFNFAFKAYNFSLIVKGHLIKTCKNIDLFPTFQASQFPLKEFHII